MLLAEGFVAHFTVKLHCLMYSNVPFKVLWVLVSFVESAIEAFIEFLAYMTSVMLSQHAVEQESFFTAVAFK